jgi:hypothetical protein
LRACDQGAGAEREQQVAGPAEEPIERERRVGFGVQEVEQRPGGKIDGDERRELIEADDESRRPAPAQRQERETAAEVAPQRCERAG